jgi:hypothetical protein
MRQENPWFPNKQIEPEEAKFIFEVCGGEPVREPERLQHFNVFMGQPMLRGTLLQAILPPLNAAITRSAGIDEQPGRQVFRQGVLFYAGVLNQLTPIGQLPCEEAVFGRSMNMEVEDIIINAFLRVREEIPSFASLMERVRPALGTERDERLHQLALVGAGVVHMVAMDSLQLKAETEIQHFEAEHPELAELGRMFDDLT